MQTVKAATASLVKQDGREGQTLVSETLSEVSSSGCRACGGGGASSSPFSSGGVQASCRPGEQPGHLNLGDSHLTWLVRFTSSFFSAPLVQ